MTLQPLNKKPLFITFEGGEGAGKTTLIDALFHVLTEKGYHVVHTREPGGTDLGEKARDLLLHQDELKICPMAELLLFLTSRAQQIHETIMPALKKGAIVLCDRFNESSIAYQGAARSLGMREVESICHQVCQGLTPDLTFILSLEPSYGAKRLESRGEDKDRMESQKKGFHEAVFQAYQKLARKNPKRIHLIDASLSIEEVFEAAWNLVEEKLKG